MSDRFPDMRPTQSYGGMTNPGNLTLIGMPGSGKSTIGAELAKTLRRDFLDIDAIIEKSRGMKLQQIIDRFGEEAFLEMEEQSILALIGLRGCVVAPGGSSIYSEKAMSFLQGNSTIFFLNVPLHTIRKRLNDMNARGIVGLRNKNLKTLFAERIPLYQKFADFEISAEDYSLDEIVERIVHTLPPGNGTQPI